MSQKQNTISYRSLARLSFLQMKRNMDKATKSGFIFCNRIILLDKGDIKMDKPHTPGSKDQELESYFLAAVK